MDYKVKKGDTLSEIGEQYGVSYKDIAKQNGISNPDLIYAGQTLKITTPEQKTATPTTGGKGGDKKKAVDSNAGNAKKPAATATAPAETPAVTKPISYGNLTEESAAAYNDLITQAWNTLSQLQASSPGAYQHGADYGIANDYLSQYQNRGPFSYDFNADALYNQYKDQYIQQGQMAMMDTMGQAAAMTGGYGNSYAQTVGQQTYNQYLGQLNEVMPELYGMAYDRYSQEGQDMLNMYGLYMDREGDNYNKYLDSVDLWNNQVSQARDNYATLYDEYTSAYDQDYTEKENERKWEYQEKQDAKTDQNTKYNRLADLIASSGYTPSSAELKAAGMTDAEAKALKNGYTSASTTGQNKTESPKYTVLDYEEQRKWEKTFESADSIQALEKAGDQMEQAGVDPEIVATWVSWYIDKFKKSPTTVDTGVTGGGGDMNVMVHI